MLEFLHIDPHFDRKSLLDSAKNKTWLVADLEHKKWLQDVFFETESWLSEDRVLRANELWLKILVRKFPDLNVVSPMFMDSFIKQWLPKQNIDWARGESSSKVLKQYMEFFLPILIQEGSLQTMQGWFKENPSALLRWGNWFQLSLKLWQELGENKFILAKWAPSYLLGESQGLAWEEGIIVDLGPDLSIVEAQLLQVLAKSNNVTIVAPNKDWRKNYSRALWPYAYLLSETHETDTSLISNFPESASSHRYVTQLSEVRGCIGQVRKWLDAGIEKSEISIVIADPEEYWPVLSAYLEKEGIGVAKAQVCVAHSIPSIAKWLSQLRLRSQPLSSEDYEASLFSQMHQPQMSYEKFRSLLSHLYSDEDLSRLGDLQKQFESNIKPGAELNRDEYISWAIQFWDLNSDPEHLRQIMSTLLLESPSYLKMELSSWNNYVQSVTSKTEIQIAEADNSGIQIRKLNSIFIGHEKYQFYLGHSDSALDESLSISVSLSDVSGLGQDLGFLLARPEPGKGQMLTDWALNSERSQSILSYSQSSFAGDALGASLTWLKLSEKTNYKEKLETEFKCRWDEIQEQSYESLEAPYGDKSVMLEDLGESGHKAISISEVPRLSASQLEAYMDCPFKFTAGKLFGLRSEPEVDLDMDRMRKGRLLHKCFEIILEKGINEAWEEPALRNVIQEARFAESIYVSKKLWPLQANSTLKTLKSFVQFERDWRVQFPKTKTVGRELSFKGDWHGHEFSGKIDRVDTNDQNQYVLIDYKSTGGSLTNYGSWLSNHKIQMLVYTLAIQNSWTELPAGKVAGAFYFNIKDWDRTKGFGISDSGAELFPEEKSKRNLLSQEKLGELMGEFEILLNKNIDMISEGRLWPEPDKPEKICERCDWRTLCRAPHLN